MAYRPGSFSKNFAWGGTGLRRLHGAIRKGFHGQPQPVGRDSWRQASGIDDDDLDLIPVNFFLHNTIIDSKNFVSVDELALQAISHEHSTAFDRLALFALNLSRGGARKGPNGGQARPALWANEFVREQLWQGGTWRRSALAQANLDVFLQERLDAQPAVRTKVRNNYRHLYELCGYLPAALDQINADASTWGVAAVFLKWDRLTLDGELSPNANIATLKSEALRGDLHKLLGTTAATARQIVEATAPLYIDVGRLNRVSYTPQQLRSLSAKIEAGITPRYGNTAEKTQRRAILDRITALERELEKLRPPHGGIGHNNPPPDEPVAETQEAISTIKAELKKEEPDAAVVARNTSRLQAIVKWLGKKADKAADKYVETLAKAGGIATVASLALWPFTDHMRGLIIMLTRWLSATMPF